uniref:Uncharacterized protein n=1 Tax=Ditylenchus dipsaci TaxID=166011 RepID=A0A915EKT2_9BILA
MSSGSSSGIFNQRSNTMEARHGARERLSSPPQKDSLTVSSYSADLSSDTLSSYNRRKSTPKAPPLVLPEEMDSEMESNVFHEVALPGYPREIEAIEKEEIYQSGNRSRRSMTRRSSRSQLSATDFSSLSEHTSPSSASASSSVEPNDHMTSSRSSFRADWAAKKTRQVTASFTCRTNFWCGQSVSLKKRKRKISGTDTCNPLANAEKRYSAIYMRENKDARTKHQSEIMFESTDLENWTEKIAATSVESMDRVVKRHPQLNSKINSTSNNCAKGACERKLRPKSMIYLDPTKIPATSSCFKGKAKSCKSVNNSEHMSSSREASQSRNAFEIDDELLLHYRHENGQLKNEIQLLKTRNNRLIDQLREKSMQMSVMQSQKNQLEIEAINASFREHSTYHEACLEQVERLQRENFSLLQLQAADPGQMLKTKIDLMPSYDALYSFTMGIVKKLGQLRKMLVEKSCRVNQTELELMNIQSSLLLTHAQVERLRLQVSIETCKPMSAKRPASFHGESFLDHLAKSELCFLLPLKLHGSRVQQQQKFQNSPNIDSLVEANEQNIEVEFLRLFDYARCLSKICEESPPVHHTKQFNRACCLPVESVIHYRNGRGTVSPMNSPIINDRKLVCAADPSKLSPIVHRLGGYCRDTRRTSKYQKSKFGAKRPMSWIDPSTKSNIYSKGEDDYKFSSKENTPNSSPLLNLHKLSNLFGRGKSAGLSSTNDINVWRSPSTTPILTRRVPLIGSPKQLKERKLVKQSSLQNKNSAQESAAAKQPLYDNYNTIGSFQLPSNKNQSHSASIFSRGGSTSLEPNPVDNSLKRAIGMPTGFSSQHRPMPSAPPISLIHSAISKLPQPSSSGGQPRKAAHYDGECLLRNETCWALDQHLLSQLLCNLVPFLFVKCLVLASNLREEHLLENKQQKAENNGTASYEAANLGSRLPKPALTPSNSSAAAAKKAGSSWLSRLRLNSTRKT